MLRGMLGARRKAQPRQHEAGGIHEVLLTALDAAHKTTEEKLLYETSSLY
jgi:hypothetical protein